MITITDVVFPEDLGALQKLILEYVAWLAIDLSYQNFDEEMASLEALFTLPSGCYFFAKQGADIAGGVGFRTIDTDTAEVKRLYVRPEYQGLKIGRALMEHLLLRLAKLGYRRVVLDAVPPTQRAQALYLDMGFQEIAPYFNNPTPNTKFYGLDLSSMDTIPLH